MRSAFIFFASPRTHAPTTSEHSWLQIGRAQPVYKPNHSTTKDERADGIGRVTKSHILAGILAGKQSMLTRDWTQFRCERYSDCVY